MLHALSGLRPAGRKKWVWASARKTRLAASGKPNALLAPSKGRDIHLSPYLSEHALLHPGPPVSPGTPTARRGNCTPVRKAERLPCQQTLRLSRGPLSTSSPVKRRIWRRMGAKPLLHRIFLHPWGKSCFPQIGQMPRVTRTVSSPDRRSSRSSARRPCPYGHSRGCWWPPAWPDRTSRPRGSQSRCSCRAAGRPAYRAGG